MIRYTVSSIETFLSIPLYVTALTVTYSSCNENNIVVVDLSSFKFLRSVVIGDYCFQHVQEFSIVGLNWLESVSIGEYSFGSNGSILEGSEFKIVNCPQLKSLYIGSRSFGRYNGFELSQLPQLSYVTMRSDRYGIGDGFRYARNAVFRGMNDLAASLKTCHYWRLLV